MLTIRYMFMSLVIMFTCIHSHAQAQERYSLDGLIEPSQTVNIASPVEGILSGVLVDRGDMVARDQIIARLDSKIEKAAMELAKAKVEFSKRKVERNEDLYKKELLSIHDKDEMETELTILELQLRQAEENVETRTIRSSIDGVVVERFLSPGERVGDDPIVRIACIDPLYVELVAPAEKFGAITQGAKAEVVLETPKQRKYIAVVIVVDKVIDAASGTFGVRLLLDNPNYSIPSGIKCKVTF
ncbi:MAG: efflux RND transporter periplasmic adaptor subunit [Deltaproteobacteria bacterium]|nr:efflux RND transporter periplasmic adaptor subunit [Deltaproteobacteria bacterium]